MSRTVETVLRLTGESEYRAGLKNCASEMKVLKSELARVSSDFRANANSVEALTAKGDVLNKMYENQSKKVSMLRGALDQARQSQSAEEQTVASLRDQYSKAREEMDRLEKTVGESSEEYQRAKSAADALGAELVKHQNKLDAAANAVTKYSSQLNRAQIELNSLSDQQDENNRLLDEAREAADGCAKSIDRYGKASKQSADDTKAAGSAVDALASAMVASGIQSKVEDLAATMRECSQASQEFEYGFAKVSTIADSSAVSLEDLRNGVLNLSNDLRVDPDSVSAAVYDALSSGIDTKYVLEFSGQSAKLAAAGFTDISTSVDVLTTILNAYNLEASQTERISSILVKTQDLGKVTVDNLGKVIGRVVPTAAAYNVNIENIAAAYAEMTAAGINAENTTTYVSTMLDELADSGSAVASALKDQTGQSFAELMSDGKSLGDVLDIIAKSCDNDKVAFSNLWSSSTAGKAAIALLNVGVSGFNRTLQQMEQSSGSVERNYKKLTDTSKYASKQVEVASKNLKIAVGDQLNPLLDNLRKGSASLLEGATKIVKNNPALVAAITGVATAMGLLATGVSALMVAKAAAKAMESLNIALMANPAGLIAAGVAGLATAIGMLWASRVDETAVQVEALTEASRELTRTVEEGHSAYEDNIVSIDATAATAKAYMNRLQELEAQGIKTNDQQQEYSIVLDKIKALLPDLNYELDAQTGLLKGGAQALEAQIEGWVKAAKAEAAYVMYKDDVAAMAKAEYEYAKLMAEMNLAEEKRLAILAKKAPIEKAVAENREQYMALLEDESLTAGQRGIQEKQLTEEYHKLWSELEAVNGELKETTDHQNVLSKSLKVSEKSINENRESVEFATDAYLSLSEQSEATAGTVSSDAGQMSSAVAALAAEYDALYNSARDSLDGQMGLLDSYRNDLDVTSRDIIDNLRSQQKAYDNYASNLTKAMEMGIDMGLIQKLSDGSEQSMKILDSLVNDAKLSVDELNDAFADNEQSKDSLASVMAVMQQNAEASADVMISAIRSKMNTFGEAVVDGAIEGIQDRMPDYNNAIGELANVGTAGTRPNLYAPFQEVRRAIAPDLPSAAGTSSGMGGSGGASGSVGKNVNVYISPKTISQSDIDMVVETVNRELGDNL